MGKANQEGSGDNKLSFVLNILPITNLHDLNKKSLNKIKRLTT